MIIIESMGLDEKKIVIAMSGGLDSSLAASLLIKERGIREDFQIFGVTLRLFDEESLQIQRVELIAKTLGIRHKIVDLRREFKEEIIDYFIRSYSEGLTPNPCALCNRLIKFGRLLKVIEKEWGAKFLATGHYALKEEYKGSFLIKRSVNKEKDQSYFLALIEKEVISRLIFPIGHFSSKEEVKRLAIAHGLGSLIQEEESQDICFLQRKTLKEYLKEHLKERKGEIIYEGKVVGTHRGIHFYTIGQRRGLKLPLGKPLYIVKIDAEENKIYLGEERELFRTSFYLDEINFHLPLDKWEAPKIQIRYRTEEVPVKDIIRVGRFWKIIPEKPLKRVTPGQICAFFEGDYLLGGGIIAKEI